MAKQRRNFKGHCRLCGKFICNGNKGGSWNKRIRVLAEEWQKTRRDLTSYS